MIAACCVNYVYAVTLSIKRIPVKLSLFTRLRPIRKSKVSMSTFVQKYNATSGKLEWYMQHEGFDFHQEIARSSYTDMLHDTERNKKYFIGLKSAIEEVHSRGQKAIVLDIGTGTGLLSMMAVKLGADSVSACEAFQPMANCAKRVIADNGFADQINLIWKRSTDVKLGTDLSEKCNILVTEVFDTELIGEGALGTFSHALEYLLTGDCIVVPHFATVYAQVAECDALYRTNQLLPIKFEAKNLVGSVINVPDEVTACHGSAALHDLQISQIDKSQFTLLTDPIPVFKFNWQNKSEMRFKDRSDHTCRVKTPGRAQVVFIWWDLEMDIKGGCKLSCAPYWAHPEAKRAQWRDHWMQAAYYIGCPFTVEPGSSIALTAYHDEYSLWFDATVESSCERRLLEHPVCTCGVHACSSRSRVGMQNDEVRNRTYTDYLKQVINSSSVCLSLGDGSLLPLIAAKLGAKKVYAVGPLSGLSRGLQKYIEANDLGDTISIVKKVPEQICESDLEFHKVNVVLCEPYFMTSLLPWNNLYVMYAMRHLRHVLAPEAMIMPRTATLKGLLVQFDDLWRIRSPLVEVEGFKMDYFDQLIEVSTNISDLPVEPQPLWEYPCNALSEPFEIMEFAMHKPLPEEDIISEGVCAIEGKGTCNGVALWMDWGFTDQLTTSTGPLKQVEIGEKVQWDMHTRQGVYLLRNTCSSDNRSGVRFRVVFRHDDGEFEFKFEAK